MKSIRNLILLVSLTSLIVPSAFANESKTEAPVESIQDQSVAVQLSDYSERMQSRFSIFAHRRTYLIPYSYVTNPTESIYDPYKDFTDNRKDFYQNGEAEFQISLFMPAWRKIFDSNWDINVAYTHHSWWQVYNADWSKPFRETNYRPEVFFRRLFPEQYSFLGIDLFSLDLGYMHESNGEIQLLSRSWDRLFARGYFVSGSYSGILTLWAKRKVLLEDDENPRILKYNGIGQLELSKAFDKLTLETQINLASKPGFEVAASYPLNDAFRWFVKVNKGYGQSLIEYNKDSTRYGAGFALETTNDRR